MTKTDANLRPPKVTAGHSFVQNEGSRSAQPRAREPISRSRGQVRGKFPSIKEGRMIHWESLLELDLAVLLEFSKVVVSYREQPLTAHYVFDGRIRRYTPDFEITLASGETVLIEVKPAQKLLDEQERKRFEQIADHFARQGRRFAILTEREIRQTVLLANLRCLLRYRGSPSSQYERRRFRGAAASRARNNLSRCRQAIGR